MSAYFSGSLIEEYGVSFVFGVTAVFPLLVVAAALLITEDRVVGGAQGGAGASAALRTPRKRLQTSAVALREGAVAQVCPCHRAFCCESHRSSESVLICGRT